MPSVFPLPESSPSELHLAEKPLADLDRLIRRHIDEGRYPGAQIAIARHGKLALFRTYGHRRAGQPAGPDTLWLLFSQTKVLTTAAVWSLVEEGALSFSDKVADHLPEFAAHGKGEITLFEVATHQAGYPSGDVTRETWTDHALMRQQVCDFRPEWPAGSRLHYHARAAHLTLAMVIEAVTGRDYREVIRERVIAPLGTHPSTFGHGGAGTSYSWADPNSGVSFTYLTNFVQPDPWHSARLDRISNLVHAAIE
jgi:CubicO group peptidase (beta-lactamase class C family)